jgi:hypothetical protein
MVLEVVVEMEVVIMLLWLVEQTLVMEHEVLVEVLEPMKMVLKVDQELLSLNTVINDSQYSKQLLLVIHIKLFQSLL